MQQKGGAPLKSRAKSLIHRTVFPNGLKVVTERMPHVRSVSLGVWIRAGSRTDTLGQLGMAHFIEHMLFKGTERRSVLEIADSLESRGGVLNAFTTRDMTCYYASILDDDIELAVDVLSDILNHSALAPEEIEREKHIVLEEIRSTQDVPEEFVQDTFGDTVLSPDPTGKPVLGSPETVLSFTRNEIIEYLARWYTGSNIVIAAAGNVHHDRFVDLISSHFTFDDADIHIDLQSFAPSETTRIDMHRKVQQAHVCIGARTFGFSDNRRTALWLLNTVLGSGMSSRLFQNIREHHGLAYAIYSFTELFQETGFITAYAATETKNCERTISLIEKEYRNLSAILLDSDTMGRAKSQLKGSLILSLENTSNRMNRLAKQEIFLGYCHGMNDAVRRIEEVSAEGVRDVAEEIFAPEHLRTFVLSPAKKRSNRMSAVKTGKGIHVR